MELNADSDLEKHVRHYSLKLLDTYKTILRRVILPEPSMSQSVLEDTVRPFTLNTSAELILSHCRALLDIIQELRLRSLVNAQVNEH